MALPRTDDLLASREPIEDSAVTLLADRSSPLVEIQDAFRRLESRKARRAIVVTP